MSTPTIAGGATSTNASNELAENVYQTNPSREFHVRLDGADDIVVSDDLEADEIIREGVGALQWKVARNHDFGHSSHVTAQKRETSSSCESMWLPALLALGV